MENQCMLVLTSQHSDYPCWVGRDWKESQRGASEVLTMFCFWIWVLLHRRVHVMKTH